MSSRQLPTAITARRQWRTSARQALLIEAQGLDLLIKAVDVLWAMPSPPLSDIRRSAAGYPDGRRQERARGAQDRPTLASTGTLAMLSIRRCEPWRISA